MGLTIHYSGRLRSRECLPALLEETIDICQTLAWPCEVLARRDDVPVEGLILVPEGSEPVWLTFLEDGTMCNPVMYAYLQAHPGSGIPASAREWLFTKTQYAGVETHMALIRLLKYLSQKYFERFVLHDESQYWETGDEAICRQLFEKYGLLMDMVGAALESLEHVPDEPMDSLVGRIERMLHERLGMRRLE